MYAAIRTAICVLAASACLGYAGALLDVRLLYDAWMTCLKQLDAGDRGYLNILLMIRTVLLPILVGACVCLALLVRAWILHENPGTSRRARVVMGAAVVTAALAPVDGMIIFDLMTEGSFDHCRPSF